MDDHGLVCPHCQAGPLRTDDLPVEVFAVIPCPACRELCVLFRGTVLPLNKNLLRTGTRRQRILHIAELITDFVDSGALPEAQHILMDDEAHLAEGDDAAPPVPHAHTHAAAAEPISEEEYRLFQQVELRAIDNAAYFRRNFG